MARLLTGPSWMLACIEKLVSRRHLVCRAAVKLAARMDGQTSSSCLGRLSFWKATPSHQQTRCNERCHFKWSFVQGLAGEGTNIINAECAGFFLRQQHIARRPVCHFLTSSLDRLHEVVADGTKLCWHGQFATCHAMLWTCCIAPQKSAEHCVTAGT